MHGNHHELESLEPESLDELEPLSLLEHEPLELLELLLDPVSVDGLGSHEVERLSLNVSKIVVCCKLANMASSLLSEFV